MKEPAKCIGRGYDLDGCGYEVDGGGGTVCPICGGMVLSLKGITKAERIAAQWKNEEEDEDE